ncbi:MAG: GDP-mannose 4,6-dehydratase [bacterium]
MLITSIITQEGSYLAEFLPSKGYEVHGVIRRPSTFITERINHIYVDLHTPWAKFFLHYEIYLILSRLQNVIDNVKPNKIYYLNGQSYVRVSFDVAEYTGNVTALGTIRILKAMASGLPCAVWDIPGN